MGNPQNSSIIPLWIKRTLKNPSLSIVCCLAGFQPEFRTSTIPAYGPRAKFLVPITPTTPSLPPGPVYRILSP